MILIDELCRKNHEHFLTFYCAYYLGSIPKTKHFPNKIDLKFKDDIGLVSSNSLPCNCYVLASRKYCFYCLCSTSQSQFIRPTALFLASVCFITWKRIEKINNTQWDWDYLYWMNNWQGKTSSHLWPPE